MVPPLLIVGGQLSPGLSRRCGKLLGAFDAITKPLRRLAHSDLRINLEPTGNRHAREHDVSELMDVRVGVQLGDFLVKFRKRLSRRAEVEPDRVSALLRLRRVRQRRQARRHLVENASTPLGALVGLPKIADTASTLCDSLPVDVRMAKDQLVSVIIRDLPQVGITRLLQQLGKEHRLEQQVADLICLLGNVAASDCLGHLERFLHRVGHDRRRRLDAIPRTVDAEMGSHTRKTRHTGADRPEPKCRTIGVCRRLGHRNGETMGIEIRCHNHRTIGQFGRKRPNRNTQRLDDGLVKWLSVDGRGRPHHAQRTCRDRVSVTRPERNDGDAHCYFAVAVGVVPVDEDVPVDDVVVVVAFAGARREFAKTAES